MQKISTKIKLDHGLHEQLREVVAAAGYGSTVTAVVEAGAAREIRRLQLEHCGGQPFPEIDATIKKKIKKPRGDEPLGSITIRIDGDLLEQLRRAAWFLSTSYSALVVDGVREEVAEFKKKFPDHLS
jgi:hypothetical protein